MKNQTGVGYKELLTTPYYKLDSLSYLIHKEGYDNYAFISNISVDISWIKFYNKLIKNDLVEDLVIEPIVFTGLSEERRKKYEEENKEFISKNLSTLSRDGINRYSVVEPAYEELTKGREKMNYRYYSYTLEANFLYYPSRSMCLIFSHGSIVGHCKYSEDNQLFLNKLAEVCKKDKSKKEQHIKFITSSNGRFKFISKEIKSKATEGFIEENYNDDFKTVSDNIDRFIDKEDQGLVLLHGLPGTGKTEYLVDLIGRHKDKEFIYLPENIVGYLNDPSFMEFVMDNLNEQVLIIEDAEKALKERSTGSSASTILNLTDGMIGRVIKSKIICTFNTDKENIDKALLRNGRLYTIYEFKELDSSKIKYLCNKHGVDESLADQFKTPADFYSYLSNKFNEKEEKPKIGFR